MRATTKLALRKMRRQGPSLMGIGLLIAVGVAFFVTLTTLRMRYEEAAEAYFRAQGAADVTFYGAFGASDVQALRGRAGVQAAAGRRVQDLHDGALVLRAVSLTDGINAPSLYEGRLPETTGECALLRRNARAMRVGIGDTIALGDRQATITGLAASPETLYLVQNERYPMAAADRFGVAFVREGFFGRASDLPSYNEIVARIEPGADAEALGASLSAERVVRLEDQPVHRLYREDLKQFGTFAAVFPAVFAVLIAVVVYVMLRRMIAKERQQIGGMMALGAPARRITGLYAAVCSGVAVPAALLGCLIAAPICESLVGVLGSMFEVPGLGFALYPSLWIGSALCTLMLCAAASLFSMRGAMAVMPAQAMRPPLPGSERGASLERLGALLGRCSFHTRYALKSALRNRGRFAAVVLGMCGATALLVFSLGFYDSIRDTQARYFRDFTNYDVVVSLSPMPLTADIPAQDMPGTSSKALTVPVSMAGAEVPLVIVSEGFDMVHVPADALESGVIVSAYHAKKWNVGVGDELDIEGRQARVSAIVEQNLGPSMYTSYDYIRGIDAAIPAAFNTLYARGGDIEGMTSRLREIGIPYSTIADDRTSFASILSSVTTLIWLLLACALVLGFTVLYSVGMINLAAREYEYLFLGVMGYARGRIVAAHLKETALQLAIAIPLGFAAGRALLEAVKDAFSGDSFVVSCVIYMQSYALAAALTLGVAAVMAGVTAWHVGRLDIAQGLKGQEA